MKVVIIGGVAGGATAAARLRRLDEHAEIIIIERSSYVSYANCGLPYFIGDVITDQTQLTLQTPESLRKRFRIDVRVGQEAISINREAKTVTIRKLTEPGHPEYTETYDKMILSPGAVAEVPNLSSVDEDSTFTLRTLEDAFAIRDAIEQRQAKSVLVLGGGFIGLELAENLTERGLNVTVIQRSNHVLPTLDADMAAILHNHMRDKGINLVLNTNILGFEKCTDKDGKRATAAIADDGRRFEANIAIIAVGVIPDSKLAADAGLELGMKGSIKVDSHMRTSDPDIYAVGDAVEVQHYVSGNPALIALAGPANKQGRIAAEGICKIGSEFNGSQGSSIIKMFDLSIATTGLNCKTARAAEMDYDYVILTSASHAAYYPGASNMTIKVVFDTRSGRILGSQIIGYDGVDKRIDVLATAIRANMTAYDLTELDLAYAPPYSSAKDPVNVAGFVICNILDDLVEQVHWVDALKQSDPNTSRFLKGNDNDNDEDDDDEPSILIDTRTPDEYARGHIERAENFPLDDLREMLDKLPKDRRILVYCAGGLRSYLACRILSQEGFDCANVSGGYDFYLMLHRDWMACKEGSSSCGA